MKDPEEYTIDEVAIWLNCIGLGEKVDPFRENAVDGAMLVTLNKEDLTGDLGLSSLQAKKVMNSVESTTEITGEGGGGDATAEQKAFVEKLMQENAQLKAELASLKEPRQAAPAPTPAPAPAPAPAPKQAPPPKNQHEIARGAAKGAAGGAMKGAIAGAILPGMDASDGAKAGAAVGATKGGLHGARARARR
jgi:hypothetical protein